MVQQTNLGIQREITRDFVVRADYLHNFGTHFIIGRLIGTVVNPVVGGPDGVVNLESSVKTKYDGLLVSAEKRFSNHYQLRASYTLSKAFNYANDDQIPFANGPIDPNNLRLEYGPHLTISAIVSPSQDSSSFSRASSRWRRSGRLHPGCRWTFSCPTPALASRCCSATRAGDCFTRARS